MGKYVRKTTKTATKNIENVCRLCLRAGSRILIWGDDCKYSYQIRLFCRVQLHKGDDLPGVICVECSATLTAMGYLREKSFESDKYLRGKLNFLNDKNAIDFSNIKKDLDEDSIKLKEEPEIKHEVNDIDPITKVECQFENVSDQENISRPCSPLEESVSTILSQNKSITKKRKDRRKIGISKRKQKSKDGEGCKTKKKRKFLCPTCGKYLYISGYNRHIELHKLIDKNINKRFGCPKCHLSFYEAERLKKHIEYHSLEKIHSCSVCDKKFRAKSDASRHMKLIHMRYQATECTICHKILNSKAGFVKHLDMHTGKKHLECDTCNQKFSTRISLINHIRLHTGEKPHKCLVCNSSFRVLKSLIEHRRLHTGEKPHRCPVCGKGFAQKGNMKSHFRYNHKDEVLT